MRSSATPQRSCPHPQQRASLLTAAAVLGVYAVIVATSGSAGHTIARIGRDWPLLVLATAVLVTTLLTPRAPRRWRALLAAAFGAAAVGVALTAALVGGGHNLAELDEAIGTPLPDAVSLPAPFAALAVVGLLLAACVSVHGAAMPRRRSRPPASPV